jgi:hypothetical protein
MIGCLKFIGCGRMEQHKYYGTPISKHYNVFLTFQQQTCMQQLRSCWKYSGPNILVRVYEGCIRFLRVILMYWSSEGARTGIRYRKVMRLAAAGVEEEEE